MARKSTTEERQQYVARQRGFDPILTQDNYRVALLDYTNYHNKNTEYKILRKWALEFVNTIDHKMAGIITKSSDYELRTIGMMGRAIMRGDYVSPDHIVRVKFSIQQLLEKYREQPVQTTIAKPVVTVQVPVIGNKHVAEVNAAIDEYLTKDTQFSMKGYLAGNNIKSAEAKLIGQSFTTLQKELKDTVDGKDDQLKEGYAHLGKVKLKRFYALVQQIIVDCAQQVVTAKVRKPRAKKVKPAHVLVAKMKYKKDHAPMKLVSERPENVIGADTVWLYDVEKRKLAVYVAEKGSLLSVKGTTITGFDVAESSQKTLRKPETVLTGNYAKRTLQTAYKNVKAVCQKLNGRTNENHIIVKVFK